MFNHKIVSSDMKTDAFAVQDKEKHMNQNEIDNIDLAIKVNMCSNDTLISKNFWICIGQLIFFNSNLQY